MCKSVPGVGSRARIWWVTAWPYANILSNHSQDHPLHSNQIKRTHCGPCWALLTTGALSMVWSRNDKRCKTLGNLADLCFWDHRSRRCLHSELHLAESSGIHFLQSSDLSRARCPFQTHSPAKPCIPFPNMQGFFTCKLHQRLFCLLLSEGPRMAHVAQPTPLAEWWPLQMQSMRLLVWPLIRSGGITACFVQS